MVLGSTGVKNRDSISNGREAEGHARDDEGSGAGVDMVAQHSGASLTATLSWSCFVEQHLHNLVLMQHDMQRTWLLVRPAFSFVRMPHGGNGWRV